MPDTSIQETSHLLLITSWKLLLMHSKPGMGRQQHGKGVLAEANAWPSWEQIQGEGTEMA